MQAQDVNGMHILKTYNFNSVVALLGTPDRYQNNESEMGQDESYEYGPNIFRFSENGLFSEFVLKDCRFAIFTLKLQGGIKIGDPLNRFNQLGFGNLELNENGTYTFVGIGDTLLIVYHENNIITRIHCFVTV